MGVGENTENPGTGGAGRGSADGTPLFGTPGVPGEGFMYGYTGLRWLGLEGHTIKWIIRRRPRAKWKQHPHHLSEQKPCQ